MSEFRVLQGDCRELLAAMSAESFDACVTDPPYGTENAHGYGRRQNYGGKLGRTIAGDGDLTTFAESLPHIRRVLKPDAWCAFFTSGKRREEVGAMLAAAGFAHFGEVVWNKTQPGLGVGIRYQHESVLIRAVGEPVRALESLLSLYSVHVPREGAIDRHPHHKPPRLLRPIVRWCCPAGGVVLDPSCGEGTTGIAAQAERRGFVGIEIDRAHHAVAERVGSLRFAAERPSLFDGAA